MCVCVTRAQFQLSALTADELAVLVGGDADAGGAWSVGDVAPLVGRRAQARAGGGGERSAARCRRAAQVVAGHGYAADARCVRDLVAVLAAFSAAERRRFCQFVVGSVRATAARGARDARLAARRGCRTGGASRSCAKSAPPPPPTATCRSADAHRPPPPPPPPPPPLTARGARAVGQHVPRHAQTAAILVGRRAARATRLRHGGMQSVHVQLKVCRASRLTRRETSRSRHASIRNRRAPRAGSFTHSTRNVTFTARKYSK